MWLCLVLCDLPGPNRHTLQAMLANLSDGDEMAASSAGASGSQSSQDALGMH